MKIVWSPEGADEVGLAARFVEYRDGDFFGGGSSKSAGTRKAHTLQPSP